MDKSPNQKTKVKTIPRRGMSRSGVKNYSKRGRWSRNRASRSTRGSGLAWLSGVAKNLIARVSILARFSGPSRGRFRPGHNLYLLAMTVAVVSEVQVPKNGCFIAAEGVPGVTPGWSHTDP